MNSIKPLLIVAVLAAIGIGLYLRIQNMPDPQPPKELSGSFEEPPTIELGGVDSLGSGLSAPPVDGKSKSPKPGGRAPAFTAGDGGGTAPVFVPPASGGVAPQFDRPGDLSPDSLPAIPRDVEASLPSVNPGLPPARDPFASRPLSDSGAAELPSGFLPQPQHAAFDQAWTAARELLDRGDLAGAHLLLSAWYGHPTLRPEEHDALLELLSGLAGTVIYSTEHYLEPAYMAQPGEMLDEVARQYNVPPELLAKINGLTDRRLQLGQQLKVVRGPFAAQIDLARQEMVLVLAGRYAGRFHVGVGRERSDVAGQYEVKRKTENPTYFGTDRKIEPGAPDNPLGTHLLSLGKPQESGIAAPFGIHGTPAAARDDALGYIRLAPQDILDAYDILSERSPVVIRR